MKRGSAIRWSGVLCMLVAAALVLAACGGGDSSSSSEAGTSEATGGGAKGEGTTAATGGEEGEEAEAKAASGTPIKVGSILATTGDLTYPDVTGTLKAAVAGVNRRGGIEGHPLKLVLCDEGNDPNKAVGCAHKLVQEKVIAAVSNQSFLAEPETGEILEKGGVPQLGALPNGGGYAKFPNSFLLYNTETATLTAAGPQVCKEEGFSKIASPALAVPVTVQLSKTFKQSAEQLGLDTVDQTQVPLETSDFAPLAQSLSSKGAECIETILPPAFTDGLIKAGKSLGYEPLILGQNGSFSTEVVESLGPDINGILDLSQYPVATETERYPVLGEMQEDLKASAEEGNSEAKPDDPNIPGTAINAWFAVKALKTVMEEGKVEPTAAALTAALKKAENVDLGLPEKWSPNKPGPKEYPKAWSATVYAHPYENEELTEGTIKVDALPLMKKAGG